MYGQQASREFTALHGLCGERMLCTSLVDVVHRQRTLLTTLEPIWSVFCEYKVGSEKVSLEN